VSGRAARDHGGAARAIGGARVKRAARGAHPDVEELELPLQRLQPRVEVRLAVRLGVRLGVHLHALRLRLLAARAGRHRGHARGHPGAPSAPVRARKVAGG
jgi:hypothetical protein